MNFKGQKSPENSLSRGLCNSGRHTGAWSDVLTRTILLSESQMPCLDLARQRYQQYFAHFSLRRAHRGVGMVVPCSPCPWAPDIKTPFLGTCFPYMVMPPIAQTRNDPRDIFVWWRNTHSKNFLFWETTFHLWVVPIVSHGVPFWGEHRTACLDAVAAVLKEIQANYSCASQSLLHPPLVSLVLWEH